MTGIELSVILQRLDRVWYDFDGGYDDTNNPFASIPEEYTKKKEEQLAKHTIKRMSAHQRQINKVREGRREGEKQCTKQEGGWVGGGGVAERQEMEVSKGEKKIKKKAWQKAAG